jgi:hypothetical protein
MGAPRPAQRTQALRAGRGAVFGLRHARDIVHTGPEHAASVHTYWPPVTAMSYYPVDYTGALSRTRSNEQGEARRRWMTGWRPEHSGSDDGSPMLMKTGRIF